MAADPSNPGFTPVDPYALARAEAKASQLVRFYKHVAVEARHGGFAPLLDGREARTPARAPIVLPTEAAAALLASEWDGQGAIVQPGTMPAVRLTNSVIDGVAGAMAQVTAEIRRFASSDLLFYRADTPRDLEERQALAWDPVLDWARETLGARFVLTQSIMPVTQPDVALEAVGRGVSEAVGHGPAAPFRLGALHVMTTLTGSTLLGLATLWGALDAGAAWAKAHVDEDFQISRWGQDSEAAERRATRWLEMSSAAALARAVVA